MYKYVIQTLTAPEAGAGTDANVYVMLVGELGDSGRRFLKDNLENEDKFEPGKVRRRYLLKIIYSLPLICTAFIMIYK